MKSTGLDQCSPKFWWRIPISKNKELIMSTNIDSMQILLFYIHLNIWKTKDRKTNKKISKEDTKSKSNMDIIVFFLCANESQSGVHFF